MLQRLAGATIQVANLVNYNCHPLEDGKNINYIILHLGLPGKTSCNPLISHERK